MSENDLTQACLPPNDLKSYIDTDRIARAPTQNRAPSVALRPSLRPR